MWVSLGAGVIVDFGPPPVGGRGHTHGTPADAHDLTVAAAAQATDRMAFDADKNGLVDLPGVGNAVAGIPLRWAAVGLVQPTMTEASAR
jgi:hypothetical protein